MASAKGSGESGYMAPELRVERERSSLELEELTNLLDSGEAVTEIRRRMSERLTAASTVFVSVCASICVFYLHWYNA